MSTESGGKKRRVRRRLPREEQPPRGDPIPSILLGSLSIVLGFVNLAALFGLGLHSLLVKQATVLITDPSRRFNIDDPEKLGPGSWFIPEAGFWALAALALAAATGGVLLSIRRGQPTTSAVGFVFNTLLVVAGFVLAFTDYRYWG